MNRLIALMRREYWENKGAFRTTPIVISSLIFLAMLMFLITFSYFEHTYRTNGIEHPRFK